MCLYRTGTEGSVDLTRDTYIEVESDKPVYNIYTAGRIAVECILYTYIAGRMAVKSRGGSRTMVILSALMLLGLQLAGAQPTLRTGDSGSDYAFSMIKSLPDGELQRIVRWNGICAREIVVDWG